MDRSHNTFSIASNLSSASSNPYAGIAESSSSDQLVAHLNATDTRVRISDDRPMQGGNSYCTCVAVVAVISLIFSTLSLAGIGFFAWFIIQQSGGDFLALLSGGQGAAAGDQKTTEVCLPCLQMSPDPLDKDVPSGDLWRELNVRVDEENATRICCAANTAQYAALFKLILQRQAEVKKLADTLDATSETSGGGHQAADAPVGLAVNSIHPPSAHLVFKSSSNPEQSLDRTVPIANQFMKWRSPAESPLSHVQKGLGLVDGSRVIVDTAGLYFIYCQIYSTPHGGTDETAAVDNSRQSVYVKRYSTLKPSFTMILLKSRHTRHDPDHDRHSSYVGGVYRLYKGDSLSVVVSRPELVENDALASFFGLFRVGD